ncbi:MAG TPA: tRNA preQ1(34) S-adenosylmethionine ribosyltransferase-isomerase QueA [Alphaproteobacteria bacterium]|nr:tRNA preQ1(34) S-adenosylmethionine ribosyltransferase-isomerase QueA [Alphaproteobacteria bacterium]
MKVDIFDFDLDKDLIAKTPANPRDSSRLLDLSDENKIVDRHFYDLPDILNSGDVLVFNDTKVIPARLYGAHGNALVELTLYHPVTGLSWWSFIKNSKRLKPQDVITFYTSEISASESTFQAKVLEKNQEDGVLIEFLCGVDSLSSMLQTYGAMPLPPYIKRDKPLKGLWNPYNDKEDYQTVYAKCEGAVAAPTAGLHFTQNVLDKLDQKGIEKVFLTLHVGAGTFLPVKTDDTKDHKMHAEFGIISEKAADAINKAKKEGRRIIAVGTTSVRLLESAADDNGVLHPFCGETNIFITPGYKFKMIDYIITNFHLPKSTLFMLICAIAGTERMKQAYAHAIKEKYRFYSYGDSSILKCVNKI